MQPILLDTLRGFPQYVKQGKLAKDISAGLIVAVIALPLSIALAIASGVSPEKGLITAIIAGFLISALGGSHVQIGGPTGAFVVIVYGIILEHGINGLILATFLAGAFLVLFGLLKLGNIIKYIPYSITVGFTAGIALTLFSTQVSDMLGMGLTNLPAEFLEKWKIYFGHFDKISLWACGISLLTIAISVFWPKINKKIPASLVALVVTTALVSLFNLPVETIGQRFGDIPKTIPWPGLPAFRLKDLVPLLQPAFTIAILAGVESLLSAVVADGMTGKRHRPNTELIAQGIANMGSALFSGIPATGAIARTAANYKNGGRTPIAGIIHALVVLLFMMVLMPVAKLIPMASLGGILTVVSYHMLEKKAVGLLARSSKTDFFVMFLTFLLTVIFDLVIAIEIGMLIAMALTIKKLSENTSIAPLESEQGKEGEEAFQKNPKIMVYYINGPLFFGAANLFLDVVADMDFEADIVIFDLGKVTMMDATAYDALEKMEDKCRREHLLPMFCNLSPQPKKLLGNLGRFDGISGEMFFETLEEAYEEAEQILKVKRKVNKRRKQLV